MATFVLIHGGGGVGWHWHLVEDALRQRGHDVVAPDLPCDDDAASLNDLPRHLAELALSKDRSESETAFSSPWPLDTWPAVSTKVVVCTEDRFFPADFMRRVAAERLGIVPMRLPRATA